MTCNRTSCSHYIAAVLVSDPLGRLPDLAQTTVQADLQFSRLQRHRRSGLRGFEREVRCSPSTGQAYCLRFFGRGSSRRQSGPGADHQATLESDSTGASAFAVHVQAACVLHIGFGDRLELSTSRPAASDRGAPMIRSASSSTRAHGRHWIWWCQVPRPSS